jgi:hypothetical protein
MKNFFPILIISISAATAQNYVVPKTEWGVPNFHGVWRHATIMPFERPIELAHKRAYTKDEALKLEGAVQQLRCS